MVPGGRRREIQFDRCDDILPGDLIVIIDSSPMRLVVSLSAVALSTAVAGFAAGVSGAAAAPVPERAVSHLDGAAHLYGSTYRGHGSAPSTGEEIFRATCAGCHGVDGKGAPRTTVGFAVPLPDFTDCYATSPEMQVDWAATIRDGGPVRGFSRIMPAFRDLLTPAQIQSVVAYIRSLCSDPRWPHGEFNVPLAQTVEKAFPEDEWILTSAASTPAPGSVENHLIWEKRFGIRSQFELDVPFGFIHRPDGASLAGGLGDISLAAKHVFVASPASGTIVSGLAGVVLPTGDQTLGLGTGTTAYEGFLLGAQLLPRRSYFQFQGGVMLPTDLSRAPRSASWGGVLGTTFPIGPITRIWSPMVAVTGTRDLVSGAPTEWNTVPELQVSLSALQHVRASVGVNIPLTQRDTRPAQFLAYLLWDTADGPLFKGWKGWCPGCDH
jgi:mono/diheme cytochrome c family protein